MFARKMTETLPERSSFTPEERERRGIRTCLHTGGMCFIIERYGDNCDECTHTNEMRKRARQNSCLNKPLSGHG